MGSSHDVMAPFRNALQLKQNLVVIRTHSSPFVTFKTHRDQFFKPFELWHLQREVSNSTSFYCKDVRSSMYRYVTLLSL